MLLPLGHPGSSRLARPAHPPQLLKVFRVRAQRPGQDFCEPRHRALPPQQLAQLHKRQQQRRAGSVRVFWLAAALGEQSGEGAGRGWEVCGAIQDRRLKGGAPPARQRRGFAVRSEKSCPGHGRGWHTGLIAAVVHTHTHVQASRQARTQAANQTAASHVCQQAARHRPRTPPTRRAWFSGSSLPTVTVFGTDVTRLLKP